MDDFSQRPEFKRSPVFGCLAIAFLCCLLLSLWNTWFFFAALATWLAGFAADRIARRTHSREADQFRENNVRKHAKIFAESPPTTLDAINGEFIDMYDLETGLYIGQGLKRDIQTLYDAFDNEPLIFENGPNDIPLTQDFVEQVNEMDHYHFTPHFLKLMDNAMDDKHLTLLTIRWTHPRGAG